jgi:ADP-heptose:LPS heptosyltransferase
MSLKRTMAGLTLRPAMAVERIVRRSHFRTSLEDAQSILILEYMLPLGCCVHLTPLYEAIRASRPDAVITVATRGLGLAVLRHNPTVNQLISTPNPLRDVRGAAKTLSFALAASKLRPDCLITGASDQRTRIGLMGALAIGGWRVGFTQSPALYHRPMRVDRSISLIENNLRLATLLGCEGIHREPRVCFSRKDALHSKELVREVNPDGRPLVAIVTQTSGGQRTGWLRDRFVQVIEHARHDLGCAVVYVGTAAEEAAIEDIRAAAGGVGKSVAGRTSVTELAALMAMSDYVVSLDTGTMHVARAVGVPMVVLGPSWQKPVEWMPQGLSHVRILRGQDQETIPNDYQLDEIEARDVIFALNDLFASYPSSWVSRVERVERSLTKTDHVLPLTTDEGIPFLTAPTLRGEKHR